MHSYVLSELADADILEIARNSAKNWGFARAERYIMELHRAFEMLSEFPHLGRNSSHIRAGYFRFEHASHSVYFQKTDHGIFIVRILHKRQQPENYL